MNSILKFTLLQGGVFLSVLVALGLMAGEAISWNTFVLTLIYTAGVASGAHWYKHEGSKHDK